MADLKISALSSLAGADLVAADVVAVVDDSASETKKLTVSDLIANGTTLISDATIPSAKILFSAGSIATASVADSGITTVKVADSSITAAKLADNSSVTLVSTLPASGDFTGQIALDTDDDKIYIWDGSAWDSVKGAGSINVVNGSTTGEINIVTSTSGDTVTVSATLDDTTAAAQFLAGPTGAGGTVGYRAIIGTDLPTASTTAKGGVIVNGNGLTMSSDTIAINNTVTAETSENHIVQYDANGLITGGRAIVAADVPNATSTTIGVIKPGSGLGVTGAGELNHDNSVTAGTASKVTFDTEGHITGTESLVAADIPDLDAAKITTGTVPTARIASDAVTAEKLADRSTATIAETTPAGGAFIGQCHLNSITGDYFLWDGNVWQPIGISVGEIILAGTYDASTNLMATVTSEGTALSFVVGSALPTASSSNKGYYVVVSEAGTGTAPAPTVALNPPDFLLSTGTAYTEIDVSSTVTAQQASNVAFTAAGNIAATNVQSAIEELDTEKISSASPSLTGTVSIGTGGTIQFEGATDNAFETTLTVVDATADRTLSLPNVSGTLVSSGDTGTVTSTMIADGTIANADISSTAEIAVSKLANGTARQLLQTDVAGSGVEFTSNVDVPGTLDVTGATTLDSTLGVTGLISADGNATFAGNVGIGNTSPGSYDSSANNLVVGSASGDEGITITAGTSSSSTINFADGTSGSAAYTGRILYQHSADALTLHTNGGLERMRILSDGTIATGGLTATPGTVAAGSYIQHAANAGFFGNNGDAKFGSSANNPILFQVNGSEKCRIDTSGDLGLGVSPNNVGSMRTLHIKGPSSEGAAIRLQADGDTPDSSDAQIYKNSAALYLRVDGTDPLIAYLNGNERFRVDSSGLVKIPDSGKFICGSGDDLEIYHDGSNSKIVDSGTGQLIIQSNQFRVLNAAGSENLIDADENGAITLYYDGSTKLATASDGIDVTGTVTDSIGNVRRVGIHSASDNFTLTTDHPGKLVRMSGSGKTIAVPQNVLSAGDMVTMFNVSTGTMTIEQGTGTTIYNSADGATGNRTVAAKGMVTLVCTASNEFVISGTQLT